MPDLDLVRLRALAQKATKGKWHQGVYAPAIVYTDPHGRKSDEDKRVARCTLIEDAEFVAACSPDVILQLVQEIQTLRAHLRPHPVIENQP